MKPTTAREPGKHSDHLNFRASRAASSEADLAIERDRAASGPVRRSRTPRARASEWARTVVLSLFE